MITNRFIILAYIITNLNLISAIINSILKFSEIDNYNPNDYQTDNITILYNKPSIKLYHNIITDKEADYIITYSKKYLYIN